MSSLTSRKKKNDTEKEPFLDPEAANNDENTTAFTAEEYDSKNKIKKGLDRCIIILCVIFTIMVLMAPSHVKARRNERMNQTLQQAVKIVEDQRKYLADKYNSLTAALNQEEIDKYKIEMERLKDDSAGKQKSIDELVEVIAQHKEELGKVKKRMNQVQEDVSYFCSECKILKAMNNGRHTSCGGKLRYFINNNGDKEDDAKQALIQKFPECGKKPSG